MRMFENYLITTINNLVKNKLYSTINIIGLALGLAVCIVISLYVRDQYSYDKQWKDSDRIYRVNFTGGFPGMEPVTMAVAPVPAMQALEQYYHNKIEKSTRAFNTTISVNRGTYVSREKLVLVDPGFIDIFQLDMLSGSLDATLKNPTNIALRADVAARYFKKQDPLGKTLTTVIAGSKIDYIVTAVYQIHGNSILDIPMISLFVDTTLPSFMRSWNNLNAPTYFKLRENIDIETLKPLTPSFIDKNIDISKLISDPGLSASDVLSMDFQNIEKTHLNSPWDTSRAGGNGTVVLSFAAVAVLVLLIAGINFMILTTAKATQRAKEVAIRKVVGAKRKQLICQFLGESLFVTLVALILSLGIVEIMLPVFESIVSKPITMDYSLSILILLLGLFVIVGISGGLYPAFILSGFRPGNTLKSNQSKESKGSITLRNILVILQFSISSVLIICTIVIYAQLKHSINNDPGFNRENLLVINNIELQYELKERISLFKEELKKLASVSDISLSEMQPSHKIKNDRIYTRPESAEINHIIATSGISYDYFPTYQIQVVAGRNYAEDRDLIEPNQGMNFIVGNDPSKSLSERNIIINESASRELGFLSPGDAIGKIINSNTANNSRYTIIGVVADNHLFSINAMPKAEVYILDPERAGIITVRFTGSSKAITEQVKSVWKKVMGDVEISTVFVDQLLAKEFEHEQAEVKVLICFALLAILIACMGLFGSASFTVERRTKEIGLRKVMGAKVKNEVHLLLWQFSKPVLIANIIAWPVAILVMQNWLEKFPYRINVLLLIPICLVSGLIAILIAWVTVAGNTTRVAKSKPIKALRYE
jgi:putative ABC transport system permease protein